MNRGTQTRTQTNKVTQDQIQILGLGLGLACETSSVSGDASSVVILLLEALAPERIVASIEMDFL